MMLQSYWHVIVKQFIHENDFYNLNIALSFTSWQHVAFIVIVLYHNIKWRVYLAYVSLQCWFAVERA